ncbi:hypothetical protein HZA99_06460 [Candidatus Woesearchaeota archaeon]|nr:hypothetical protein [Candidatus Woesearchaeota archaeon]
MRKIIIIALLSIFLIVASCGQQTNITNTTTDTSAGATDTATGCPLDYNPVCGKDGLTYQNTCFSSLRNVGIDYIGVCNYEKCSFNGQDHYVLPNILYYEDNKERPYIEIIYGTFRLQEDGDGWTFIRAINTGVSYYYNRMLEYNAKMTESGNPITCTNTTEVPDNLKEFLKTHGKIVTMIIEGSAQNATESNLSDASVSTNMTE